MRRSDNERGVVRNASIALAFALAISFSASGGASGDFGIAVSTVWAEKQAPPAPGTPKGFTVPEAKHFQLDNGMQVTLVPYGKVPKVDVRLVINTGNIHESADEVWLADLTMNFLEEGTTERTAEEIAAAVANMGGSLNSAVGPDNTFVGASGLSEFSSDLVKLVGEVVRSPRFADSELERLKKDMVRLISISRSRQQSLVGEKWAKLMYGEHPYGRHYPSTEMIASYTMEQVRAFYAQHVGAKRAHLYVAGRFDMASTEATIRSTFGGWNAGAEHVANIPKLNSKRAVHLIDRPGAVQSTVWIGLPAIDPSHPDFIPLSVANTLLGGSFASRVTANIREDKGYTYSPRSQIDVSYRVADWRQMADITTAQTGPAIGEIFKEIERLRTEPASEVELTGIRQYITGLFVIRNSSRQGIIGQLMYMAMHGLPGDYLETYVQKVLAVTPADVQSMAQKYLDPGRMTIVIAGDSAKIRKQIEPFGEIVAE